LQDNDILIRARMAAGLPYRMLQATTHRFDRYIRSIPMKIRATLLAAVSAALLGACTSTGAVLLDAGPGPERHPDEVRVYLHEDDVPSDYEQIALVTARSDAGWTDETALIRAMQRRAARLGADAIIVGEIREPSTVERVAEVLTDYEPDRRGRAVAIRLLD
jgi:hypothetical protein